MQKCIGILDFKDGRGRKKKIRNLRKIVFLGKQWRCVRIRTRRHCLPIVLFALIM